MIRRASGDGMPVKVECESCKAPYTIDERRIPASGLRVRCPKCAKTFVIKKPADGASAAADPTAPSAVAPSAAAVAPPLAAPLAAAAAAPDLDLPAAVDKSDLPAAVGVDSSDLPAPARSADLPALGARPKPRVPASTIGFAGAPRPTASAGESLAKLPATPPGATPPTRPPETSPDLPASRPVAPAAGAAKPVPRPFTKGTQLGLGAFVPKGAIGGGASAASKETRADLPAAREGAELPATRGPKNLGEIELPAPKGTSPGAQAKSAGGDLPAPKTKVGGDPFADLPAVGGALPAPRQKPGDLPAVRGGAAPGSKGLSPADVGLPAVSARGDLPASKAASGGFGDLDLPDLEHAGLPAVSGVGLPAVSGGVGLPAVSHGVGLPAVSHGVGLPAVSHGVGLPAVTSGAALPAPAGVGLPAATGGRADLPSLANASAHLPAVPAPTGRRPAHDLADDPFAPNTLQGAGASSPAGPPAFGELELPGPAAGDGDGPGLSFGGDDFGAQPSATRADDHRAGGGGAQGFGDLELEPPVDRTRAKGAAPTPEAHDFGDLDLSPPSKPEPAARPRSAPAPPMLGDHADPAQSSGARGDKAGGMGFGEVDLPGSGGEEDMEFGAIPQADARGPAMPGDIVEDVPQEFEAPAPRPAGARVDAGAQPKKREKSGNGGKITLGLLVVLLLGGAGLEFTKHGAFGRNDLVDRLNADKYAATTEQAVRRTHESFGDDSTGRAADALAQLDRDVASAPRYRPLVGYAAYANFADEIRFGKDGALDAKGNRLIAQVDQPIPQRRLAEAARDVVAGQLGPARGALKQLLVGDTLLDAAVTLGELELRDKKPKDAVAAFTQAKQAEDSARTRSGLMRALDANGDGEAATKEATELASKYPKHVPSRLLLARRAWQVQHDEKQAMHWLDELQKPEVTASAAPGEIIEALTLRGDVLLERGRVSDARAAYDQAMAAAKGTSAPLAQLGLGEVDMAAGQYASAIAHFNAASQAQPDLTPAKIGFARAKLKQELAAEAKSTLQGLKDPRYAGEVGYWLGQAEEKLDPEKPANAMKIYSDAIKAQPTEVKAYIALATLQAKIGKPEDAETTLTQALKAVPPSDKLHLAVGTLKFQQAKYDAALAEFLAALKIQPENLEARFDEGRVLLRMPKRRDEGKTLLDEVEKRDPKYPGLALEFGYYYLQTNQVAEALKRYQGALDAAPNDVDVKLNVGIAMVESGNPEAEQTLRDVLDKCASQSASPDACALEAKHYLGRALLAKGSPADALIFLKQAVEKSDSNPGYHLFYGWALEEMQRYDDAGVEIDRAIDLNKSMAEAYWLRAEILSRKGQFKDAIAQASEALKQSQALYAAHATIAYSMKALGNEVQAIPEYRKAIDGAPNDSHAPWWRFQIADILYHQNQIAAAAKDLKEAIAVASTREQAPPWLGKAYFYLGESLRRSDREEAKKAYRTFLEKSVGSTDPARPEARSALAELGSPYNGP